MQADAALDAPPDAPVVPVFRNPVSLPDDQLATQALQLLGANVSGAQASSCNTCHTLTRQHLRYWRGLGDGAMATCLTDLAVQSAQSAKTMADCIRMDPGTPGSNFLTEKLGIYASAGRLPWFDFVFKAAYGADAATEYADFLTMAAMPHGSTVTPFTQPQFDIVAEWFARGLPRLDDTLPEDPPPATCEQSISADVATHVATMATQGWRAVNHDNALAMYDCGTATDPKNCLADLPRAADQTYGATWDAGGSHIRILKTVAYHSSYWTRSSPDGRFVAHGGGVASGTVQDLQRGVAVGVPAPYDPGFFPDNSGWMFQGNGNNSCSMAVLTSLTGTASALTMSEPGCTDLNEVGLYQHVGKMLGGGDYFAINGSFYSDNGGHSTSSSDPGVFADENETANLTPMLFNGTTYVEKPSVSLAQPFEADAVLSPSARVEMTRVAGPSGGQLGYVLHKVIATPSGSSYTITAPEIARYCVAGGKPAFSYDERWLVYHHYTGDRADLYLMDLRTGVPIQITHMNAGQYALFPHFRSDGWIYADVRTGTAAVEYLIASDAALLLE